MRNDIITSLSESIELFASETADDGITEEERVAACVAAAFGLATKPEGYAAFNTAVKAAQMLMDRVQIPVDGHYLEREARYQSVHGRPSLQQQARLLAASEYDRLAATNGTPEYHDGYFLKNYPTKEGYVNEWWEERYLPVVEQKQNHSRYCYYDAKQLVHGPECRCIPAVPPHKGQTDPKCVPGDNSIDGPAPKW